MSYNLDATSIIVPTSEWLGPIEATLGGSLLPILFIAIHCYFFNNDQSQEDDDSVRYSIPYKISRYFIDRSWVVLLISIPVAILLCVNQMAYMKQHLSFITDLNYYLRMSSTEYEKIESITTAAAYTSYKNLVGNNLYHNRNRRSLSSAYESQFIIIYYKSDWSNTLTSSILLNICSSEKNH